MTANEEKMLRQLVEQELASAEQHKAKMIEIADEKNAEYWTGKTDAYGNILNFLKSVA